jgi:hypothetical protein
MKQDRESGSMQEDASAAIAMTSSQVTTGRWLALDSKVLVTDYDIVPRQAVSV